MTGLGRFIPHVILLVILAGTGCKDGARPGASEQSGTTPPPAGRGLPGNGPAAKATGHLTGDPAGQGVFRGRVIFRGDRPKPRKLLVVKDVAVCGIIDHLDDRLVVAEKGGIRNAVVSIKGVNGGRGIATMGDDFVLDQKTCAYFPHVLLVPVGKTLKVLNSDGVLHNIHTYSSVNPAFNVAQPKALKEIKKTFSRPERIAVKCDVHGWMSSWVIVVDHPYHAVTDEDGRFEISGIPPGRYVAECWQEELGTVTAEVTIGEGGGEASHDFVYDAPAGTASLN